MSNLDLAPHLPGPTLTLAPADDLDGLLPLIAATACDAAITFASGNISRTGASPK